MGVHCTQIHVGPREETQWSGSAWSLPILSPVWAQTYYPLHFIPVHLGLPWPTRMEGSAGQRQNKLQDNLSTQGAPYKIILR